MKKLGALLLAAVMIFGFGACSARDAASYDPDQAAHGPKIVCTTYPICDWAKQILGDAVDECQLVLLGGSGVDLHSYQPSVADIAAIASCDLFFYVGGESDEWVEDALAEAVNPDMVVINLVEELGENAKAEEIVEGMETEEEEEEEGGEGEEEEVEIDEHVWLSLRNAQAFVSAIAGALETLDPANADTYRANAEAYGAKLAALDAAYAEAVDSAAVRTLLFGDRFPFRYLTDDYGLTYYAAFVGCSAETEASFQTVIFLAQKTDELQLPAVMTIEGKDHRIAETVISSTANKDQKLLTLDSMQGTTAEDVANGATYLKIMEDNLEVLKEALN